MALTRIEPKDRPSNRDLQDRIIEVHDCTHQLAAEVRQDRLESEMRDQTIAAAVEKLVSRVADIERVSKDNTTATQAVASQVAAADARVGLLVDFWRVPQPSSNGVAPARRLNLASLKWWEAVIGIVCTILGSMASWKYVIPSIEAGAVAFYHSIMAH
jgi:hypothetical protein